MGQSEQRSAAIQPILDLTYDLRLGRQLEPAEVEVLKTVPGLRVFNSRPPARIEAPYNAGWLIVELARAWGISVTGRLVRKQGEPSMPPIAETWAAARDELLGKKLVRERVDGEHFLDQWLRSFQRDTTAWHIQRGGGTVWAEPGCLSGDTEIIVNRAGKAFRLPLVELVRRFNGGETPGGKSDRRRMRWDPLIPTRVQGPSIDGFGQLHEVVAAVSSGQQMTYHMRTSRGDEIRATADHLFFTPIGWQKLSALRIGDEVYMLRPPRLRHVLNNDLSNLEVLCASDHFAQHSEPVRIVQIEPWKIEPTYDLSLATEPHAFAANGFITHNSGKTPIAVLWGLLSATSINSALVVVTRGGARWQWFDEIVRFSPLRPHHWKPPGMTRQGDYDADAYAAWCRSEGQIPIVVCGWEQLVDIKNDLLRLFGGGAIVWDEVHKGKQDKRKKWKLDDNGKPVGERIEHTSTVAYEIACQMRLRLATTGTPIYNLLSDLWGELTLVEPAAWGETSRRLKIRYGGATVGEFNQLIVRKEGANTEEFRKRLSFTVSQIPWSVSHGHLPPKIRRLTVVPVERQLVRTDKELTAELKKLAAQGGYDAVTDRMTELRIMDACTRKRPAIVDAIENQITGGEGKRKCLVLTGRHLDVEATADDIEKLAKKLKGPAVTVWRADGTLSGAKRRDIQKAYMAHPGPCVLVATYQSFGESLDLDDTDYVAVPLLPYTVGMLAQIEGRPHRQGTKRNVLIEFFIAERSVDERIRFLVLDKLPAVERVTGTDTSLRGIIDDFKRRSTREARMKSLVAEIAEWFDDVEGDVEVSREEA